MKLGKLLLAVVSATVLLGALVGSASAGRLEMSSQNGRATWAAMTFSGGSGTVECEVVLEATFHSRTMTKTAGSLVGYVTAGNINRCARGGSTINRASLPWHVRYRSFAGTLPSIVGIEFTITGAEWTTREPSFGITCTVRAEQSSTIATYSLSSGTVTSAAASGESRCGEFTDRLGGSTTNVGERGGARLTVRLI